MFQIRSPYYRRRVAEELGCQQLRSLLFVQPPCCQAKTSVYTCMHTNLYMNICIYGYMDICTCFVYICIYIYKRRYMYTYIHTHTYTYMCVYIYTGRCSTSPYIYPNRKQVELGFYEVIQKTRTINEGRQSPEQVPYLYIYILYVEIYLYMSIFKNCICIYIYIYPRGSSYVTMELGLRNHVWYGFLDMIRSFSHMPA